MRTIRACTTLATLRAEQEARLHPATMPQGFGQEAVAGAPAAHVRDPEDTQPELSRVSPAQQAQTLEELPRQSEGTQRFMQYYVTSAPHARSSAPLLPKMNWESTAVASYTGMEWDSVVARSNGIDSVMLVNMVMDGFVGVCADVNHRLQNGEAFFGPFGAFWSSLGVIGFETGYNHIPTNLGGRFNGNINLSATDHIFLGSRLAHGDMHTETGFEAARIRSRLSLTSSAPAFRAEVSSSRAQGICGAFGLSAWTWVRALCRIDYTSSHDISYSTWTSGIAGRLLSMDGMNVFNQWLHNMWQTLWSGSKIAIPSIFNPECMALGDNLRATFSRRRGNLLSVGTLWAYAGRHDADVDQTKVMLTREVGAQEPSTPKFSKPAVQTQIQQDTPAVLAIQVSAQKVRSRRWFTVISGGAGADSGKHLPDETKFSLKVTLTPEISAAYKTFMPAIREAQSLDAHRQAVEAFARIAKTPYQEEQVTGRITSSELGVRVGLFPMNLWNGWVPRGFSWGLANHKQTSHMTHTSLPQNRAQPQEKALEPRSALDKTGPQATVQDFFLNQTQRLRGPDGDRTTDAVAVVRQGPSSDKADDSGVILATRTYLSRADGGEVTRLLVDPFNQMYGAQLAPMTGAGWRVSREVSIEQCLTPVELRTLSQLPVAHLGAAALAARCPKQALWDLTATLKGPANEKSDAHPALLQRSVTALEPFLAATGASGVAAIYRALTSAEPISAGEEKGQADTSSQAKAPKLIVRSHSDAYDRPRALLDTLYLRYHDAGAAQRTAMQKAVTQAQDEILVIADLVRRDSFIDAAQKRMLLQECSQCSRELTRLYVQPDHIPASKRLSHFALDLQNFSARHNAAAGLLTFSRGDGVHKELEALRGKVDALRAEVQATPNSVSDDNRAMLQQAHSKIIAWELLAQ